MTLRLRCVNGVRIRNIMYFVYRFVNSIELNSFHAYALCTVHCGTMNFVPMHTQLAAIQNIINQSTNRIGTGFSPDHVIAIDTCQYNARFDYVHSLSLCLNKAGTHITSRETVQKSIEQNNLFICIQLNSFQFKIILNW